jgi:alkylhydroperoxidase family enzyme
VDFTTTWRTFDLDAKTHALLAYAEKLTEVPGMIEDEDVDALRAAGWSDDAIYDATLLIALLNFTGRIEAASGLPLDHVPDASRLPEASAGPDR